MSGTLTEKIADAFDAVKQAESCVSDALNALQVENGRLEHERDGAFRQVREQKKDIEELQILLNQSKAYIVMHRPWDESIWCKRVDAAIEGKPAKGAVQEYNIQSEKIQHCFGTHCGLYGERACICLCAKCSDAKARDH